MFVVSKSPTAEITISNSQAAIQSLVGPVSPGVQSAVRGMIAEEAEQVKHAHSAAQFAALSTAAEKARLAEEEYQVGAAKAAAAEQAAGGHKPDSLFRGVLFMLCAAVCVYGEFTLTLVTLPYILGIRPWTVLGITLALAPTTAVIILDMVVSRLIEDPWDAVDRSCGWRKAATVALMVAFLGGIGVGNIWTVGLLADARERVTELRRAVDAKNVQAIAPEKIAEHRRVVREAVWAVSIFVTLDGALFSLFGPAELRRRRARRQAEKRLAAARSLRETSRRTLAENQAALKAAEHLWGEIEDRAAAEARRYQWERQFHLEQALAKPPARRSGHDIVTGILNGDNSGAQPLPAPRLALAR